MFKEFWLVMRGTQGPAVERKPRHKHKSQESAEKEAERLANLEPGFDFHVLHCISTKKVKKVSDERTEGTEVNS